MFKFQYFRVSLCTNVKKMKSFNDLHYLPMSHIFLPLCIILPLYHFAPPPPGNRLMIYAIYPCPVSFCPLDSFCPHIILPPIILPPGNLLMYTIFPCPIKKFCQVYHFAQHIILPPPPIILPPNQFTLPPYHFLKYQFCPLVNGFMIKLYLPMSRMVLQNTLQLDFVFILIKSPYTSDKAYDRRASGDCGHLWFFYLIVVPLKNLEGFTQVLKGYCSFLTHHK